MTKTTRIVCLYINYTHHIGIPTRTGIKNNTRNTLEYEQIFSLHHTGIKNNTRIMR